jgi:hypothetical protein
LSKISKKRLQEFQELIGYKFNNDKILGKALTHSSYANENSIEKTGSNERLEFLGDAVLELTSSEYLYELYKDKLEGELSKIRASLVCESSLAKSARDIKLGEYILLGKGEESTGGRDRNSITSDAFEAIIGAIYLDGGFANAKEFIHKFLLDNINTETFFFDSKTILQEELQKRNEDFYYKLISENGPDHLKEFTVAVMIAEKEFTRATGKGKKIAEQEAARLALKKMGRI